VDQEGACQVSDCQLPPDMDMVLMDLQKLQKHAKCLHNEMNSLYESYQKLNNAINPKQNISLFMNFWTIVC
jgi:hypothetical protein